MRQIKKLQQETYPAVEQLWAFSHLTPENNKIIRDYIGELENEIKSLKFLIKHDTIDDPAKAQAEIDKYEAELSWFEDNVKLYRNTRISILEMHQIVRNLWEKSAEFNETVYDEHFFNFKELVEMINCYFNITAPYKPANKIAYGWKFSMDKQYFRKYLLACIRNYLNKNNVEFKMSDLQKICCLKDINEEDC